MNEATETRPADKEADASSDWLGRVVINKRTRRRGVITLDGRWCWIVRYDEKVKGRTVVVNAAKHSLLKKWEAP